jgi:hypothetical protein
MSVPCQSHASTDGLPASEVRATRVCVCVCALTPQDPQGKQLEQAERLRFGRFYYRFPDVGVARGPSL